MTHMFVPTSADDHNQSGDQHQQPQVGPDQAEAEGASDPDSSSRYAAVSLVLMLAKLVMHTMQRYKCVLC